MLGRGIEKASCEILGFRRRCSFKLSLPLGGAVGRRGCFQTSVSERGGPD
jgi:hypothetical protein